MRAWILVAGLLSGCVEGLACGTTFGFVSGSIVGGVEPLAVVATSASGTPFDGEVDGRTYELNVPGDATYTLVARDADGCASAPVERRVATCTEQALDLVIDAATCAD
jgi:hypothetical protein